MKITAIVSFIFLAAFAASAQDALTFNYQINGPVPAAQTFPVTSTNPSVQIPYLTVSVEPQTWLTATLSSTTTPSVVTVSLLQAGLSNLQPGNYSGNVAVSSFLLASGIYVRVALTVTAAAPRLSLSSSGFLFNAFENGPTPPSQNLVVGASNSGVGVLSTLTVPLPKWLTLYNPLPNNPNAPWTGTGTAPVTIAIAANPTGLAPGSYSYTIPFSSSEGSNVAASVIFVVAAPALTVDTNQLQLQCSAGLSNPPSQAIRIQSTSGAALNASVALSVPWLIANVQSGATPFSLNIQPDCAALAVGTYATKIVITDTSFSDSQTVNVVLTVGQPLSSIANVTNAAVPGLDNPPATVTLAPRSMATIFGSNLADSIVVSPSPWSSTLGGTEVHLAGDTCFDASCELLANLIFVSPAQINFLVPDTAAAGPVSCRIVLLRDGQHIDDQSYMLGGPGRLIVDPSGAADSSVVFEVGYDCLFSSSLIDPASCGLSWSTGQDRAPLGAITDAISGQLISSQNPVYQGRLITLWITGLAGGVALDSQTGLLTGKKITPVGFGVAQFGKDIEGTLGVAPATAPNTPSTPIGTFMSPTPLWAGESPQFVGLDQVNVAFPTCTNVPVATSEKRYDAFLTYTSLQTGVTSRIYIPFDVRVGDPDCQWTTNKVSTSMSLASNPPAPTASQATALTATVTPVSATGVVTFFEGNSMLGSANLNGGVATLSVTLAVGSHSITALYNGDSNSNGSSASLTLTVTVGATTVSVTSNKNPAVLGAAVTFTATVSPATATGSVTFLDGATSIGSGTLHAGTATLTVTTLSGGSHTITANYSGDSNYLGSTSAPLTQSIGTLTSSITVTPTDSVVAWGQSVMFTVTISPSTATGTVTFFDGVLANCNTAPVQLGSATTGGGRAQFAASFTCTGVTPCSRAASSECYSPSPSPHQLWAVYNGDTSTASSTSQNVQVTVNGTPTTTNMNLVHDTFSNSNPAPGDDLAWVGVSPPFAAGSVEFFYMSGGSSVPLLCGGTGSIPILNTIAFCTLVPNMFPGPGSYRIGAAFYPVSSQYYYSDSYQSNGMQFATVQVTP